MGTDVNILTSYCRIMIKRVKIFLSRYITLDGQNRLGPQSIKAAGEKSQHYKTVSCGTAYLGILLGLIFTNMISVNANLVASANVTCHARCGGTTAPPCCHFL